jgi:pimeloyl-ACP methyl ester carboxylesterase
MAFVNNKGVRIHYEVIGQGAPLVLQHGLTASWADWVDSGYTDALKKDYQLILPDARGHGDSDKPHDPAAYDHRLRVSDVVAVLDDLGISQADYFGYSMGGYIGLGLAMFAANRVKSFVIGGTHPYAEDLTAFRKILDPEVYPTMIDPLLGPAATPDVRARMLKNDLKALAASTVHDRASIADDVLIALRLATCLLFVGDKDPRFDNVTKFAAQLPKATCFTVPGCDHVAGFTRSELVLPKVREFLASHH